MTLPATTLAHGGGATAKVYHCRILPAGTRYVVNYAYEREGQVLNTGTGTNVPVELAKAERIFRELVRERAAKGYRAVAGEAACNP